MEFMRKISALQRREKERGLACGGGIHPEWAVTWTWNRPRSSAIDFSSSFAWANKGSHELFISASIWEDIWLWAPVSSVFLALWCGSSRFQSISAGAIHADVKTMPINESHSPRGDPWKTCYAVTQRQEFSFHFGCREIKSLDFFPSSASSLWKHGSQFLLWFGKAVFSTAHFLLGIHLPCF